ncbi:MAG: hypothetical protein UMR38_03265 [Candidatus Izemoplasma sp.]|nr:hypothetical protein [Candidatus Izemoplasma sp.]
MAHLQTLMRLRQLKLYATIKTTFKNQALKPWQRAFIEKAESDFKAKKVFVDIDYGKLYDEIKNP